MNKLLDRLSEFIAANPGMLPLLGVLLIVLNFGVQFVAVQPFIWLTETNLLLHLGAALGIFGILLARALQ